MASFDDFDEGGGSGPFIRWHPRASEDGMIPAGRWSLKAAGGERTVIETMADPGFVVDLSSLKTGWERSGGMKGVAPDRVWGDSPAKRPPRPESTSEDWHPALSVRMGLSKTEVGEWTQGGAGAWQGLVQLMRQVLPTRAANPGLVPLLRQSGVIRSERGKGTTQIPQFTLIRWVPRPAVLDGGGSDGFDEAPVDRVNRMLRTEADGGPYISPSTPAANSWADDSIPI